MGCYSCSLSGSTAPQAPREAKPPEALTGFPAGAAERHEYAYSECAPALCTVP